MCFGFVWPGLGRIGGYRNGFYEKLPEASPCPAEAIPGGSRMDLLLAKPGPIRNGGDASLITCLRRKKKLLCRCHCAQRRLG